MSQQKPAENSTPEQRAPLASGAARLQEMASPFFWLPTYSRQSAALLALTRSWLELMARTPAVMAPLLTEFFAPGSFDMRRFSGRRNTFDPGRRTSAVVIDFPDRRKTGT